MNDELKLGWRGFDQAKQQLLDEIQKNGDPLVPLGNLMNWAYAIDQTYKNRIADGETELRHLFKADAIGEVYNGFRSARASVAHNLTLISELVTRPRPQVVRVRPVSRTGGSVHISGPAYIEEWQWTQRPALLSNKKGVSLYQKHLDD